MILYRIFDRSSPIQTVFDGVTFKKEADDAAQEVCNLSILPPMSPASTLDFQISVGTLIIVVLGIFININKCN